MAKQVGLQQAFKQQRLDIDHWAQHTLDMIRQNFAKRKIFPEGYPGPYEGYKDENEKRKSRGQWFSTGRAYNYIHAKVKNAADGDEYRVDFFFHKYLRFVDAGVGKFYHYQRGAKKAKYGGVYEKWGTQKWQKRKQRPFLNMEFRHQLNRVRKLMILFYGNFQGELTGLYNKDNSKEFYITNEE